VSGGRAGAAGPTVLVVEDDDETRAALTRELTTRGYRVAEAADGKTAMRQWEGHRPDVVLLDLGLPDIDGLAVVRRIRREAATPIVILSGRYEERQKVEALEQGADDYVTKPFGPRELVARLQAALRRAGAGAEEPTIRADGLEVNLAARVVRVHGEEVHLTPIEFDLLRTLARHRGRLLTHRALLVEVWGIEYANDTAVLRTHIANLRRKIGADIIRTDPGVGYRFTES
jgi:two-component system, OmpR family, KDP operon response regulator KdpE